MGKTSFVNVVRASYALTHYFEQICQEIIEKTGHDIIIHYNNTELLSEKSTKKLFENLRDFFQTEGVHFVFVGNLTVKGYFLSIPRFSSIMTDTPISIEPFTIEEVDKIIEKRFESMQIEGLDYVVPFTKDCLKMLYGLWGGNIRHILNSLSTAVQELTVEKPVTIDENILAKTLNSVLEKRYYSRITPPRALDVLKEIVKREEITNPFKLSKIIPHQCPHLRRHNCCVGSRSADARVFLHHFPPLPH